MIAALREDVAYPVASGAVVQLRAHSAADLPYVYDTWTTGAGLIDLRTTDRERLPAEYHRALRARIATALEDGMRVVIAYDPSYPTAIAGYAAHRGSLLDWIYVRGELRRYGVARALVAHVQPRHHSRTSPLYVALIRSGVVRTTLQQRAPF